ncbi:MAG: nickel pincer cofactor biosynthesis protein LarB [Thermoplasmata archaeon]
MRATSQRRAGRPAGPATELRIGSFARIDQGRSVRIGLPEIILGEGKSPDHLVGILRGLARRSHGALVSRPTAAQLERLALERRRGLRTHELAGGRVVRLAGPLGIEPLRATIAIVAAGTSDVPVAEECRAVLREMGARCRTAYDVGVAGLHRLLRALSALERARPHVYLVFAGREGALPTVVAGLVSAPVLGVPVSVGYGRGGRGEAALGAMLQSCAPIAVVNIDAAVPAALWAARVARRAAEGPVLGGRPRRRARRPRER